MIVKFDFDELKNLISNFSNLAKVSVCIFDINYKPIIAFPPEGPELCRLIKSTAKGNAGCMLSDIEGCKKAGDQKAPVTYVCHAGLCETVTPIIHNNEVLGYIMFGEIADESVPKEKILDRVLTRCKNYGVDNDKIREAFAKIQSHNKTHIESASNIMLACTIYIYLSHLIKVEKNVLYEDITEYLRENYCKKITIEDLCKKYFVSRSKLFKLFKENAETPMNFLLRVRIDKACNLLTTTDLSVTEIAEKVGIPDYNYFIKVFKKITAQTPYGYKKHLGNNK